MAFVVYVNSGDVRGRLARALARGAEVKRTSKQGARETPKLQGSTCSAWARVFQTASVSHSESLAAKRFSSWHLYTHPSSFSIIVVSGGYYRFSNNVVSFSRNVVPKQRMFLGQAIYVLVPLHLRSAQKLVRTMPAT